MTLEIRMFLQFHESVVRKLKEDISKNIFLIMKILKPILCVSLLREVSYFLNLAKTANKMPFPFNFAKISKCCYLVQSWSKNLKLSPNTPFHTSFKENVLPSLLLFSFVWHKVTVSCVQCNKIASYMSNNFNNSWPSYVKITEVINVCQDISLIENWKCQLF